MARWTCPFFACGLLASCIVSLGLATHVDVRHTRLRLNTDCGFTSDAISVVTVGNQYDAGEPHVKMVWIRCVEGVRVFKEDYNDRHSYIHYVFYATIHTIGVMLPCTFPGPYTVPDTDVQRYAAVVTVYWSDHRYSLFQITCDLKPFTNTTTAMPPGRIYPEPRGSTSPDSRLIHEHPSKPPTVSTRSPKPPTMPTRSSKPPTVPTRSSKPPTMPTRSSKPPTVPTRSPKQPTVSTRSSKPPTVPTSSGPTTFRPQEKENFIVLIVPHCGSSIQEEAWIEIVTDINLHIVGVCKDNRIVPFTSKDGIHFMLPVFYNGAKSAADQCVFEKRKNSKTYNLLIEISRGKIKQYIHTRKSDYQVTCTFEALANKTSLVSRSSWRRIAPKELQSHQGVEASSKITMEVVDILNHQVSRLLLGKKIRLKLNTSGAAGELGLRPSSCDMVGRDTGHRYALLRAGCGDGIIFPRRSGFISYGLEALSPYFESVTLSAESYLKFECNFTLCSSVCGGSSCVNERRRRDDMEHGHSDMRKSTKKPANIITVFTTIRLAKSRAFSPSRPFNSLQMTSQISTTPELSTTASRTTVTAPRGGNRRHGKFSPLVALALLGFVLVISLVVAVYLCRQRAFRYVEIRSKG